MEDFVTLGYLGTLGGCVGIVTLATQVAKNYIGQINPKYYVFFFSTITIGIRQGMVIRDLSPEGIAEGFINLALCMAAASGLYSFTVKPVVQYIENKNEEDEEDGD